MGTNFLAAGFLQEQLAELHENAEQLKHLLEMDEHDRELLVDRYAAQGYYTSYVREVEKTLEAVVSGSRDVHDFLSRLSCQPIIYTGEGETQQVVDMLERLLMLYQTGAPAGEKRRVAGS